MDRKQAPQKRQLKEKNKENNVSDMDTFLKFDH